MDNKELTFSFMRSEDVEELSVLARRIWLAYYPSLISQAQIEFMLERNYNVQTLRDNLADGQSVMVVRQEGYIKGFLGVGELAKVVHPLLRGERIGKESYFLHRCYLVQELHGRGAGKALFDEALNKMPQVTHMRLQVHRGNIQAQKFYKRQGFQVVAEHDFDLGQGFQMTDYVMEWKKNLGERERSDD